MESCGVVVVCMRMVREGVRWASVIRQAVMQRRWCGRGLLQAGCCRVYPICQLQILEPWVGIYHFLCQCYNMPMHVPRSCCAPARRTHTLNSSSSNGPTLIALGIPAKWCLPTAVLCHPLSTLPSPLLALHLFLTFPCWKFVMLCLRHEVSKTLGLRRIY